MHHLPVANNGCPMGACVTVKYGSGAPIDFIFVVVASEMVKGECGVDVFFCPTGNMFVGNGNVPQKEGTANSEKKNALSVH